MVVIVDDFNIPSHGVRGNAQRGRIHDTLRWGTKLFRLSRVNLCSTVFTCDSQGCVEKDRYAHPLYRVSSPKLFDFPLLIVRSVWNRWRKATYEAPSLSEIFGGTTAHFPCMYLDIEVGLSVNVLNLVDPGLQPSALKDGRRVTGRI